MKIDLESGRGARNDEMKECLNLYVDLMKLEVRPEDVTCPPKSFRKNVCIISFGYSSG